MTDVVAGQVSSVEELLDEQERLWNEGQPVSVEALLEREAARGLSGSAVLDLICNERRLRAERFDLDLDFQRIEYRRRFPQWGEAIDRQIECERALMTQSQMPEQGDDPPLAEAVDGLPTIPNFKGLVPHGEGGFGIVYRARQILPDREVAIKIARAAVAFNTQTLRSLHREASRAAKLRHVNIVEIYEVGTCDGLPYFVMPFVQGDHLGDRINDFRGQPIETTKLMMAIARAVHYAHTLGVLHCDIKPANVLIDADGRPLLSDFGLAVALHDHETKSSDPKSGDPNAGDAKAEGSAAWSLPTVTVAKANATPSAFLSLIGKGGTPAYMAPEQLASSAGPLSARTDIYGLGGVLYQLLTGRPPGDPTARLPISPPRELEHDVPRDLDAICMKCLEASPRQRYESAEAFASDLENYLTGRPVLARTRPGLSGATHRLLKWVNRERWMAGFLGAISLGTIFVIAIQAVYSEHLNRKSNQLMSALDMAAISSFELGKMAAERGPRDEALDAYRQALALFRKLNSDYPDRTLYRIQLAKTKNNLGTLLSNSADSAGAESLFREAIDHLGQVDGDSDETTQAKAETANVYSNLGNLLLRRGDSQQAEAAYAESERLRVGLLARDPANLDFRMAVAKSQLDFGNLGQSSKQTSTETLRHFENAFDMLSALLEDGFQSPEVIKRLSETSTNLGILYDQLGKHADAARITQSVIERSEKSLQEDPGNSSLRLLYAIVLNNKGLFDVNSARLEEGVANLSRARDQFELAKGELVNDNNANTQYGACLANLCDALSELTRFAKSADEAQALFAQARKTGRQALEVLDQAGAVDPTLTAPLTLKANTCNALGTIEFQSGNLAAARPYFEEAIRILDRHDERSGGTPNSRVDRLFILNNLGRLCVDSAPPDLPAAEAFFRQGIAAAEKLLEDDPSRTEIRDQLMFLHNGLGLVFHRRIEAPGDATEQAVQSDLKSQAEAAFAAAIRYGEASLATGSRVPNVVQTLAITYAQRATLRDGFGDPQGAGADWDKASTLVNQEMAQYVDFVLARARSIAMSGDHARAIKDVEAIEGRIPETPGGHFNAACVLAQALQVVDNDKTLSDSDRGVRRQACLTKAVDMLKKAAEGGLFSKPEDRRHLLDDPDLNPIRTSPEFKSFLQSLARGNDP
jgi:serine/threonine protein kinase